MQGVVGLHQPVSPVLLRVGSILPRHIPQEDETVIVRSYGDTSYLWYHGYRYSKSRESGDRDLWRIFLSNLSKCHDNFGDQFLFPLRDNFSIARFGTSLRGNPVILVGQFRFNKERANGIKTRWSCVKKRVLRCTASLMTTEGYPVPSYSTTQRGNIQMIVEGYRFYRSYAGQGSKVKWNCVKRSYSDSELIPEFLKSKFGRPVIELGGFRYNKRSDRNGRRASWRCVKKRRLQCPAFLVTMDKDVIEIRNRHNHN
ncbi:hypothetical protein B5X24_HaOG203941 [Helicoverpa armigera]|uniref:FLYWCH-type domain-containing protein n=1 Tax=Helicoverpa armigera TaxID=29058 RepID=A0A2W1BW27_HELAM|nr:hypothetical protein B5X24_HaOG203941 [Helicoverpa armigera]